MVDAVREHLTEQQAMKDRNGAVAGANGPRAGFLMEPEKLVCPDHDERLKLFCETDQKLVCLICRDGDQHQGHKFKPVDEAAEPKKVSGRQLWVTNYINNWHLHKRACRNELNQIYAGYFWEGYIKKL